ncbi:alcohol dehydrogenase catalytic domain-containing protein [Clostridium boliviensis]|uniref:Alcohol dehydrogenase catalytic domain-containing protein n=1 Tax=Clostridium boliviensis TaxID=318465 RepID=A0ABU4GS46_9CLOT|nr:alcohol dehydrogenase catalytic domain-containing protein [Clostridium boliviensis]MDW2800459.1 alcohol dehydrogenase catalytic domain-containing protein [Clostridium boliviensis]
MKQISVKAPFQYSVEEAQRPKPSRGEVLVKMKAAGVCGSDFHLFLGENPMAKFPRIPGHENAGIIEEVGEGVTKFKKGDHVVVDLVVACGSCKQCKNGRRNICRTVKARGAAVDGGWREYFTAAEHEVYLLPEDLPFEEAALIEPFAIGGHCTKRADVQESDVVLILGMGTIGTIILQVCKEKGCKVICADIKENFLKRAENFGADFIVNTKTENLNSRIQKYTNGEGADVIFDAAGYPGSLTMLLEKGIPANGARIVPLGFCTSAESITQSMINGRELSIIGTRMSSGQFVPTIEKFRQKAYRLDGIVSDTILFSEIDQVFKNMQSPPEGMAKMVILFE